MSLAWFRDYNARDFSAIEAVMTKEGRLDFGGHPAPGEWGGFTHIHCQTTVQTKTTAVTACTFHEDYVDAMGNPDSSWGFNLTHTQRGWKVVQWGQG